MPLLDVTDVLFDPDFMDTMTVTRSARSMSRGRTVLTPQIFDDVPCAITAATGDDLLNLPEGVRVEGTITVHTTFRLFSETEETKADVITFNGRDYVVTTLNDWSRYGSGFVQAYATLKNLQEAMPS